MRAQDSVPPLSGGVAHAMAVGAEVGVSRCRAAAMCPAVSTTDVAPDLGEVPQADPDVFLREILARFRGGKLGVTPTPAITSSSIDLCSAPSRLVASLRPSDCGRLRP